MGKIIRYVEEDACDFHPHSTFVIKAGKLICRECERQLKPLHKKRHDNDR